MFPVSSSTGNVQQSPKTSPVSSRQSTPERRESVGSNGGVLGVGSVSTPIVDECLRLQLNVTSVDSSNRSVEESPNEGGRSLAEYTIRRNSLLEGGDDTHRNSLLEGGDDTHIVVGRGSTDNLEELMGFLIEEGDHSIPISTSLRQSLTTSPVNSGCATPEPSPYNDEHRDQHSPLPHFPKSPMKKKDRESLDSIRSETELYLSPSMRELYKNLGLGNRSSVVHGQDSPGFVRQLNLDSEKVVAEAIQYRDGLEERVLSQEGKLVLLERDIINEQAKVSQLIASQAQLETEIGGLNRSLLDKKIQLEQYTKLLDESNTKYDATKKLVQRVVETKAALEIEKDQLALEIKSLKNTISPADAAAIEEKISQKYQAAMQSLSDQLTSTQEALGSVSSELAREKETSRKNEDAVNRLQEQLETSQTNESRRSKENVSLKNDIAKLKKDLTDQARTHREQLAKLKPAGSVELFNRPVRKTTVSFTTDVVPDSEDLDQSQASGANSQSRLQLAAKEKSTRQRTGSATLESKADDVTNEDERSDAGSEKNGTHRDLQAGYKDARKAALLVKKTAKVTVTPKQEKADS